MPKRSSKASRRPDHGLDVAQNAKRIFDEAMSRSEPDTAITVSSSMVSFIMAEMGRKGGKIGGKRRLETMTPERRQEIGRLAAEKRWAKTKKVKKARKQ